MLTKSNDDIPEWTNTNWNINAKDQVEESQSSLAHLFDWDCAFYSFIPESEEKTDAENALKRVLMNNKW
jgi:hypothetical protein